MAARQRASRAADAFARVGTVQVGGETSPVADIGASISAGNNASDQADIPASVPAGPGASRNAGAPGSTAARGKAGRARRRRVGRPRGPDRVPLTVRILAATDARLTAAVDVTGQSPQYLVDAALAAYLDALGIPQPG